MGSVLGPTSPTELYASIPLPPGTRSIRLLDLEPLPSTWWPKTRFSRLAEDDATPLAGRLRVVSLASSPTFAALSYVWGAPPSLTNTIRCGTCSFPLTQNCADALRVLRRRSGNKTLTIWVDALCINQGDSGEQADQIPLMEEIYLWADPVFVWLGRATESSDRAMERICRKALNSWERRNIQLLPSVVAPSWFGRVKAKARYGLRHITDTRLIVYVASQVLQAGMSFNPQVAL